MIGDGTNFVRTMASLAERGIDPSVVDDQLGRLTFADEIAAGNAAPAGDRRAVRHLQPHQHGRAAQLGGDRHARCSGCTGHDGSRVTGVSTAEYFAGKQAAPRPRNSVLELGKLSAAGFTARDQLEALEAYLAR